MKINAKLRAAFSHPRFLLSIACCLTAIIFAVLAFTSASSPALARSAADSKAAPETKKSADPDVVQMVGPFSQDRDLREMPDVPATEREEAEVRLRRHPLPGGPVVGDPIQAVRNVAQVPVMPSPAIVFNGVNSAESGCGCLPPDTQGDIGPNHYIQSVNSGIKIFGKTGTVLKPFMTYNAFFAPMGTTPCGTNQNDGDGFVFYDHAVDRWVVTDFAFPAFPGTSFYQCIGVSKTNDPVGGGWWLYAVQVDPGNPSFLGDYPKLANWIDGWYLTMNLFSNNTTFNGVRVYALNRAAMINGTGAPNGNLHAIGYTLDPATLGDTYSLVPASYRAGSPPPAGLAEYLLAIDSPSGAGVVQTQVHVWRFKPDFVTPGNSVFGIGGSHALNGNITVNGFVDAYTSTSSAIVPQPVTTALLDTLGDKIMTPVVYTNFGGTESLWASHTVNNNQNGTGPTAIRWYQFSVTGNTIPATAAQQQTFNNGGDGIWRFQPSIAVDSSGNMAIGYSASSSTVEPSIRWAGRLAGDPANNLGQGEAVMKPGGGHQTSTSGRWGDYSYMSIDPSDNVSFWHTHEYYSTTSSAGWNTAIGKFSFVPAPSLTSDGSTLLGESCSPANGVPDPGETVVINLCVKNVGNLATTNAVGTLQATGGVTSPSGPQNFGAIPAGGTVCKPFRFVVGGSCGGTVTATLQIQDGANSLGTLVYTSQIGGTSVAFSQNFDGVTAPALPAGWTSDQGTNGAASPLWVTSSAGTPTPVADTAPNAAFTPDPGSLLDNRLYSPVLTYGAGDALTFRQNMDLEEQNATTAYDAGVLEMAVNGGAWVDIVAAGGTFAAGGYNHTGISTGFSNPLLPSRACWSGSTGGFTTATVNLPAASAGQPVQFRWRMGSDSSVSRTGWRVDSVSISRPSCATSCAPTPSGAVSRKNHAGPIFDVPLPLSGTPGIEPRRGGSTGDHTIVMTFPASVSVSGTPQAQVIAGTAVIGSGGVANGGAVGVSGSTITVPLTNVANAQTIYVAINGVTSGGNSGTEIIPMSVLLGDTSGDGVVNSADLTQTRSRSGQPLDNTNFRSDVSVDNAINSADATVVRNASGTALP